ncbi:hypothetical protein P0L94_07845 [Microbacter sp. GSS18]|nr:hypothetical protein P0L94_07845 [Microbacter sp. GSS18]
MATGSTRGRGRAWAILGAGVLLAGIVAIIVAAILSQPDEPAPSPSGSTAGTPAPTSSAPGDDGEVVDASASDRGWVPEPITTDRDLYVRAALAAASTFDTQLSTRREWLAYLDTWFTADTRYTTAEDQADVMDAAKLEMRQGVVLPDEQWDSLAGEDGRVIAAVTGDVAFQPVSDDASGDMSIGTADVVLTFVRSDGSGGDVSYDEVARVSVQVLCGPGSVPTPDSGQSVGDCKVVRYFTEPLEP